MSLFIYLELLIKEKLKSYLNQCKMSAYFEQNSMSEKCLSILAYMVKKLLYSNKKKTNILPLKKKQTISKKCSFLCFF